MHTYFVLVLVMPHSQIPSIPPSIFFLFLNHTHTHTHTHTRSLSVQLKDVQGHLYNLRNVRVQFTEPPSEPRPDSKLRILLGEAVHATTPHSGDVKAGGSVHIGNVTASGSWGQGSGYVHLLCGGG